MEGILEDLLDEREILASFDVKPIAAAVGYGFVKDCSETYLKIPLSTHDPLPLLADRLNLVVTLNRRQQDIRPTLRYRYIYDMICRDELDISKENQRCQNEWNAC